MAASADIPFIDQSILESITQINALLHAIMKMDVSLYSGLQDGTIKMGFNNNSNSIEIQRFSNNSWTKIGRLLIDVESVDGYSATPVPEANTIAVRDADGELVGNIKGHANSATTAQTLSSILPFTKGGTAADSIDGARFNLGISQLDSDVEALDIAKFDKSGGNFTGPVSTTSGFLFETTQVCAGMLLSYQGVRAKVEGIHTPSVNNSIRMYAQYDEGAWLEYDRFGKLYGFNNSTLIWGPLIPADASKVLYSTGGQATGDIEIITPNTNFSPWESPLLVTSSIDAAGGGIASIGFQVTNSWAGSIWAQNGQWNFTDYNRNYSTVAVGTLISYGSLILNGYTITIEG